MRRNSHNPRSRGARTSRKAPENPVTDQVFAHDAVVPRGGLHHSCGRGAGRERAASFTLHMRAGPKTGGFASGVPRPGLLKVQSHAPRNNQPQHVENPRAPSVSFPCGSECEEGVRTWSRVVSTRDDRLRASSRPAYEITHPPFGRKTMQHSGEWVYYEANMGESGNGRWSRWRTPRV